MTINQLFCPCLGALIAIAVSMYFFAWTLCVIAKQSDARMEEQEERHQIHDSADYKRGA